LFKFLPFDKTFTFLQNFFFFMAKPLPHGKPFYFLAKTIPFSKTSIFTSTNFAYRQNFLN
jgi:hypothetical protein